MLNIVYPYKPSVWDEELKYSLRSLDKYLNADYRIIVFGTEQPTWLDTKEVEFINSPSFVAHSRTGSTQFNQGILFQLLIQMHDIESFCFFNDDMYLLQPSIGIDVTKLYIMNYLHDAKTICEWDDRKKGWFNLLRRTQKYLYSKNKTFHNYETHLPYLINTSMLSEMKEVLTGEHLLATRYFNERRRGYQPCVQDIQISSHDASDKDNKLKYFKANQFRWFNHSDKGLELAKHILPELFPYTCRYERC